MQKRIVITGGDGFIGSHLSKYLVSCGYEVFAVILPNSPTRTRISDIEGISIVEGDLQNIDSFYGEFPSRASALIHLAWYGVSPESRNSIDIQKNNLELTLNAVRLAERIGVEKFIFPGSTFEYLYSGSVINRNAKPSPQDAYGATKIAARYYSEIFCKQLGISFVYVVISGVYAADRLDNNVINYTITELLHNRKPSLTKLEQLWDYVYIDDVVNAIEAVIRCGKKNGFYVIGHGDNWPLSEYIYKIRDLINPTLPLGIGDIPYTNDILPMSCVDLSELQRDTGFIPKVDYQSGIKLVIEKIKERESLL